MIDRQKVVIIGHGYTSRLGVIRAVAQAGCEITVIVMAGQKRLGKGLDTTRPIDCYSKYVDMVYYCHKKDEEGLVRLLLDKCRSRDGRRVIVIPDSDFSASVIDKNLDILKDAFVFPHIRHTQGEVTKWMDKDRQKELARTVGLHVAGARVVDVIGGKYKLPAGIVYPCFPKPLVTLMGDKYMKRCDNEADLRAVIEYLGRQRDNKVLVEDFKVIEEEYALLGFSDGTEVVIPGIIHFVRPSKSHFGLALQGEILPVGGFEEVLEIFRELIRRIGYVGVFDIDFFRSDGVLFFDEVNLRIGGSGYAVTKMGVNLPAMMVRFLSGESYADLPQALPPDAHAVFVNERMCLDDWFQGYLSTKACRQIIESSDISFVRDEQDPGPQQALEREMAGRRFRRLVRKIVKLLRKS